MHTGRTGSSLVLGLLDSLSHQDHGREVTVRLGRARCDRETFRRIFRRISSGTYLEEVDLQIEEVPQKIGCGCGYSRRVASGSYVPNGSCPRCGGDLAVTGGDEFEVMIS